MKSTNVQTIIKRMQQGDAALYDGIVEINLDTIVPMIALPFHPSNAYPLADVIADPEKYLGMVEKEAERVFENNKDIHLDLRSKIHNGKIKVDQGSYRRLCGRILRKHLCRR